MAVTGTTNNPIDLVATHADLVGEIGSEVELRKLLPCEPADKLDPTKPFRERAYQDVLKLLSRKTPPIKEGDLSCPADVRDAVIYGTFARLYRASATTEDDVFAVQWRHWERKLTDEVTHLRVRVNEGATVHINSIAVHRR